MSYKLPKLNTTVSALASGSAITLSTATPANVTSISLTAGTYLVSGIVNFQGVITVTGAQIASTNTTSATVGTQGLNAASTVFLTNSFSLNVPISLNSPEFILTLGATTTVYLVAQATFSGGTCLAYGSISAVRLYF